MIDCPIPILGFVAYSGTGKTTLLKQLLPLLKTRGIRTAMIKHAHHDVDVDTPGKDSYELRKAGATQMLLASSKRWALMVETPQRAEARLDDMIRVLNTEQLDLILVEGFKHERYPKIECHRNSLGQALLYPDDSSIIAIASDEALSDTSIPRLDLNNTEQIVNFIQQRILDSDPVSSA